MTNVFLNLFLYLSHDVPLLLQHQIKSGTYVLGVQSEPLLFKANFQGDSEFNAS